MRFLQRRASRRVKGSMRRRLANEAVAKLRRHLANRRRDAAHKLSTRLATTHTSIAIEDLKLKEMTASAAGTTVAPGRNVRAKSRLNRGMLAQGHADFHRMLAYKCERSGALLVTVDPAYTSQTCSQCGHCAPENRKNQAVFLCVACGSELNADRNAALNILAAGQGRLCAGRLGVTPAGFIADREDVKTPFFWQRSKSPFNAAIVESCRGCPSFGAYDDDSRRPLSPLKSRVCEFSKARLSQFPAPKNSSNRPVFPIASCLTL
jgi:IS605 OrfB family transposase